jgi:pilus assembly protein CpaB
MSMRLDKKFVVVVGISLGWALLVSAAFYRMAKSGARPRPASPERDVVVATQPLEMGAVIKAESVKLIRVPEPLVPKGAFSKKQDVLDRPVISPIQPDEPVLEARLAVRGSGGGVAPLIPPGMRAISVRVNEVVGVAGFVLPGMRVDVLVTGRPPGRDDTMTTTVLQNISVLSVGQTLQVDARSQSIKAPVVTLLVTPLQAEVLTLADNQGHIQLVLRNSTDHKQAETAGSHVSQLYGQIRRELPVPKTPRPAAPRPVAESRPAAVPPAAPARVPEVPSDGILVIRGNQKVVETVESKTGGTQ